MNTNQNIPHSAKQGKVAAPSPNKIKTLMAISSGKVATPTQQSLDLGIEKQTEVNGVGMGVLSDGTPFLTGRGLAKFCGVSHTAIQDLGPEWEEPIPKSRISAIRDIVASR